MASFLHNLLIICCLALTLLNNRNLHAQAPSNLSTDVALAAPTETSFAPYAFFSSTAQVLAAFNKGRRSEETQLGLSANSLGTLTIPANYATLSDNQRALYLINAERQARAGINYGSGAVLGKPLEGVETALDNTAQAQADYLFSTNTFSHTGAGNTTPLARIEATYPTACLQRNGAGQYTMGRTENIYYACGGSTTYAVEQAIFSWIYQDTGASWGHREAVLIQNVDASGNTGYVDDRGAVGVEGFLGIGVTVGSGYTPCGSNPVRLVVLNVADPSNSGSCVFNVEANPLPVKLLFWKGSSEQKTIKLEWATVWEENADYFVIQRSTDAKTFMRLGEVKSKGTTQDYQSYQFMDETPSYGNNYYRLIQVDAGGSSEISRIISVSRPDSNPDDPLVVYPNPIRNEGFVRLKISQSPTTTVHLYDLAGLEVPTNQWWLDNQELAIQPLYTPTSGLYSIIVQKDGKKQQAKLIIN